MSSSAPPFLLLAGGGVCPTPLGVSDWGVDKQNFNIQDNIHSPQLLVDRDEKVIRI